MKLTNLQNYTFLMVIKIIYIDIPSPDIEIFKQKETALLKSLT